MRRARPRWRKATWALTALVASMPAFVLAAGGAGVVGWSLGLALLGMLWLANRPGRDCPRCRAEVRSGFLICRRCGYDFFAAAPAAARRVTR
jgi:hypothetical protein